MSWPIGLCIRETTAVCIAVVQKCKKVTKRLHGTKAARVNFGIVFITNAVLMILAHLPCAGLGRASESTSYRPRRPGSVRQCCNQTGTTNRTR